MILNIIAVLVAFFIVVGSHEFGHFFIALRLGVIVKRVNIGLGKPRWRICKKENTQYSVSLIPLGGYVKLLDEREGNVSSELLSQSITRQPAWKRLFIFLAGPLMNGLLALVLFSIVFMMGLPLLKPVVGEVVPESLAEKAGFQQGDMILSVNAQARQSLLQSNWILVNLKLIELFGEKGNLMIGIEHANAEKRVLKIPIEKWKLDPLHPDLLGSLGIKPDLNPDLIQIQKKSLLDALQTASIYIVNYGHTNGIILYKVFTRVLSIRSLAGPLAMWDASVDSLKHGLIFYLFFLGLLSVSVGFFNLLPIPGLDGFQVLMVFIEKIMGKPISTAVQVLMYRFGLIALAIIFVQIVLNDLGRYFEVATQ